MSAKKPEMSTEKARALLSTQEGQLIRGVKIEWSSVHGPGHPFAGGFDADYPCRAIHAGTNPEASKGKKSGK